MIEYAIENGANNWNMGLDGACEGGHMKIVIDMVGQGATRYNFAFEKACWNGHLDVVKYIVECGATDYKKGLRSAVYNNHKDIVKWIVIKLGVKIENKFDEWYSERQQKILAYSKKNRMRLEYRKSMYRHVLKQLKCVPLKE